jgi:tetratricopeptide (TPR) repeat protein
MKVLASISFVSIYQSIQPYFPIAILALILYSFYKIWTDRFATLAGLYFNKENFPRAISFLKKAIAKSPKDYRLYYNWGCCLVRCTSLKEYPETDLFQEACEKFRTASQLKPSGSDIHIAWGEALCRLADNKEGAESDRLFSEGFVQFQNAIRIKPSDYLIFWKWGHWLSVLARRKEGFESESLFQEAFDKYGRLTQLNPKYHDAYISWGLNLASLAHRKDGEQRNLLFQQALEKIQRAHFIKPKDPHILDYWGGILSTMALSKNGKEKETLYHSAIEKYQAGIIIKPDFADAFRAWGDDLCRLATMKDRSDRKTLYQEAIEKMQCALQLDSRNFLIRSDYADMLATIAADCPPSDPAVLFQTAFEHFKRAIELNGVSPYLDDLYDNWGLALLRYIECFPSADTASILEQAKEKFLKAESLKPGTSAYNLACVFARQGDPEQCRHWLELAEQCKTLPSANEILQDSDFSSVRNEDWFQRFITKTE